MGKTKNLASEPQEKEMVESKKHLEPISDATKAPSTPRTIKMKGLSDELYGQLLNYLDTKPHGEVKGILASLSQAPVLDVTFTN